ncbi:MAG: 50S ribosomal protein L24 [Crenarchaeota archaeon]|nr:50S ribosomal protein L24 [Thermoproteota archaeon]
MKIYKCSFCGSPIPPGFGITYVKKDGTVLRFCSRKCFVSMIKYGRDPRKLAWVRKRLNKIMRAQAPKRAKAKTAKSK